MKRNLFLALSLVVAVDVSAQSARTFVSTTGTDSAGCGGPSTPCRSFAFALGQTVPDGEIVPLTSGGYGTLTIDQAVQIVVPSGIHAAITSSSGAAVTINAATTDRVVLKGLWINSTGARTGIHVKEAGHAHLENLNVAGFGYNGIRIDGTGDTYISNSVIRDVTERFSTTGCIYHAGTGHLFATDLLLKNCTIFGIKIDPSGDTAARATIDHVRIEKAERGVGAGYPSIVVVRDSVITAGTYGFIASAQLGNDPGTGIELTVENCTVSNQSTAGLTVGGFGSSTGSTAIVSNSTFVNNYSGLRVFTGNTLLSRGNNTVSRNGTNTSGSITPLPGL